MLPSITLEVPVVKLRLIENNSSDPPELCDYEKHQSPDHLRRSTTDLLLSGCGDVCAVLLWFVVLLYALLLWYSHGTREVDLSNRTFDASFLMDVAKPLSTVFTILFAATTGRFIKSFGTWLLQRGCSIRTLDRLFGSTTVGGTVLTNLMLGIPRSLVTCVTITVLLCLWTLSPLASQAVLRIMSIQPETGTRFVNRTYMNISDWGALEGAGSDGSRFVVAPNTVLSAALIAPLSTKNMPRDLWGNVKIPLLDAQAANGTNTDWQTVQHKGFDSYSSLIGLPIAMPISAAPDASGTTSTMVVSSWYWEVDCAQQPWTTGLPNINIPALTSWEDGWKNQFVFHWTSTIYEYSPSIQIWVEDLNMTRAGSFCHVQCDSTPTVAFCPGLPARTYGIVLDDKGVEFYGMCTLKTIYVETEVRCDGDGCLASRVRKLNQEGLPPPQWNILDICLQVTENYHPLGRFFTNLVDAFQSRVGGSGGTNSLVGFIKNPANAFGLLIEETTTAPGLADQPVNLINQRLAQVLNSYWMANLAFNLSTGDWGDNFQDFHATFQNIIGIVGDPGASLLDTSIATVNDAFGVFTCNLGWLTAFTIATVIALLMSVAGLVAIVRTRGPILAMNVSTMVRESPYVQLSSVTSAMDDNKRSRRVGHTRVMFGDVAPDDEVGHVAIAQMDNNFQVGKIRRNRLYV